VEQSKDIKAAVFKTKQKIDIKYQYKFFSFYLKLYITFKVSVVENKNM
jgi:uncharacterized protein YpmS